MTLNGTLNRMTPGEAFAEAESTRPKAIKKIAIVGRAPSSMNLAPFDDPEWEIWSLSNAASLNLIKRWDRWFELHNLDEGVKRWGPEYKEWLAKDHGKPLYISAPNPIAPYGTPYPWEQVFAKFGRYLNNSISEMICLAAIEGATHIGLYGVDMAQADLAAHDGNGEYQHQRPSCEYHLGIARGMGIEIILPEECDLLKCARIYAYHDDEGNLFRKSKARKKELQQRQREAQQNVANLKAQLQQWEMTVAKFEGALEDNDYWQRRVQA